MKRMFCLLALGSILWATPSLAAPSGATQCYLLANNASAQVNAPYTPDSRSAYNAAGGAITVTHTGTGTYSVECFNIGPGGIGFETVGNVQVTAVGPSNIYCHVDSWSAGALIIVAPPVAAPAATPSAAPPIVTQPPIFIQRFLATVVCFGPGGGTGGGPKPADSEFSLLFVY